MNLLSSLLKFTADKLGALISSTTSLGNRLSTAESDIDSLEAQFTTVVSAVTTDTEVTNIRVGDDGVTYDTAGNAVRKQFSDLKSELKSGSVGELKGNIFPLYEEHHSGSIYRPNQGQIELSTNSSYNAFIIKVDNDSTYYFDSARYVSLLSSDMSTVIGSEVSNATSVSTGTASYLAVTYLATNTDYHIAKGAYSTAPYYYKTPYIGVENGRLSTTLTSLDGRVSDVENGKIGQLRGNIYPLYEEFHSGCVYRPNQGKIQLTENSDYNAFIIKVDSNKTYYFDSARFLSLLDADKLTCIGSEATNVTSINTGSASYLAISYIASNTNYTISPYEYSASPYFYKDELLGVNNDGRLAYLIDKIHQSNPLRGKKYYAAGDSYTAWSDAQYPSGTEYAGQTVTYDREIRRRNSMTGANVAEGGSTIALSKNGDASVDAEAFSNTIYQTIPADTDYLTISFGINDTSLCNLGEKGDTLNTTFWGAWDTVLQWFASNRPNMKIGIIIFQRNNNEFYQAAKSVAEYYGIPYIDFYGGIDTPMYVDGKAFDVDSSYKAKRKAYFHGQEHQASTQETFQDVTVQTVVGSENLTHPGYRAHIDESTIIEAFLRSL